MFLALLPLYKRLTHKRSQQIANEIHTLIPENVSLLDFGCGNMLTSLALAVQKPSIRITGVDIIKDQNLNLSLINNTSNVNFVQSDAEQLPFENNTFDITLAIACLHHTCDPEYFLEELKRVTKASGAIIIVEEMYIHYLDYVYIAFEDWILNKIKAGVPVPLNFFSKNKYLSIFKKMNLHIQYESQVRPFPTYMHHYIFKLNITK